MLNEIEGLFPNLAPSGYEVTGEASEEYNCIAWALGATAPWWGYQDPGDYWPPSLPRDHWIGTVMRLFAEEGFEVCEDDSIEPGYEKIGLYAFVGRFTHVARQLEDGQWTSKLGNWEVITHPSLAGLASSPFGEVHCIMRRPSA